MARVSERIEHHARKVKHHITHAPRKARIFSAMLIVLLLIVGLDWYEAGVAVQQNTSSPVKCTTLFFSNNRIICERRIIALYQNLPPLERAVVCKDKRYGDLKEICGAYEDAAAEQLYGPGLQEQGISPWEPTNPVPPEFRIRSLNAMSSVQLVCDRHLVRTTWHDSWVVAEGPVNGTCVLIAMTAQGSITSLPFNVS